MPRSKKFLVFILILLVVNTTFFVAWYWLGLRNFVRAEIAQRVGILMHGDLQIKDLRFSDRQLYANGISFTAADSSLAFSVERLRVQYNLTRYLLSGFKLKRLVGDIDIYRPVVTYNYHYKSQVRKHKKQFTIPDLAGFFGRLTLSEGRAVFHGSFPIKILKWGDLQIGEELSAIDLKVINKGSTKIALTAISKQKGKLIVQGILDKGRIVEANAELVSFHPLLLNHPDVQDFSCEVSAVGSASQDSVGARIVYEAKAQVWGANAVFAGKYPVRIPFLSAATDGEKLSATLRRSTFGSSNIEAKVAISNLGRNLKFDSASLQAGLDLGMISPDFSGFVSLDASASGTIDDPEGEIKASSAALAYQKQSLKNLSLSAVYRDSSAVFQIEDAVFENQKFSIEGSFDPFMMALSAKLNTSPLSTQNQLYYATAALEVSAEFLDKYPLVRASISALDFNGWKADIHGVAGTVLLVPMSAQNSYLVDASLTGEDGFSLSLVGDILSRDLLLDASFKDVYPARIYAEPNLQKLQPMVGGTVKAIISSQAVYAKFGLDLQLQGELPYKSRLEGLGSYFWKTRAADLYIAGEDGELNNQPLNFNVAANLRDNQLRVQGLGINDFLSLSGRLNLKNVEDCEVSLALKDISARDIVLYYPAWDISLPEFHGLSVFADYNLLGKDELKASIRVADIDLLAVTPLNVKLDLDGSLTNTRITGEISGTGKAFVGLQGSASLKPKLNLALEAVINDIVVQQVLLDSPVQGYLKGMVNIDLKDARSDKPSLEFGADLQAKDIKIGDYVINIANVKAAQYPKKFVLDSLYVYANDLFVLNGSGALDYNLVSREFFEGDKKIELNVDGQLFRWLKNLSSYVLESHGNSSLRCSIGTMDEQFEISSGELSISDGYLKLKDQSEPITDIFVKAMIDKNRVAIEQGQLQMGNGKLVFNNIFEADNSDHFMLGFLDLGIIRLQAEEPGISVNIPMFTTPRTLSNIILRGQGSRFATVKGPFDLMKINGEVVIANTSVLFPPNTPNLLKLATSLRDATSKHSDAEMVPLPFTMDVLVSLGDNVSYNTYPARLNLQQGGYLHLLYDGLDFTVQDANFTSERGSIDIFGTVFQVEKVDILMVDSQDLLSVAGKFYKRASDGTLITLNITTSSDRTKGFADRLEFSLTSDNPEDRGISQILARLRYNGSKNGSGDIQNGGLQDEALSLISGNLDSTLLTPFFSPVENYIRRRLKLDNFSISAGFLQNLYTQYSNPNQTAGSNDLRSFTSDITQFSSSILLNNFSLSMSKYLGRRLFLDYVLELQESTDLQKATRLLVSHETSIRLMLPKRYRLGYTFKYAPLDSDISHEIMLQRSFQFWGL